ncbi:MAG: DUF3520 domain-containing protein, partial [Planctomycetales bacterium]
QAVDILSPQNAFDMGAAVHLASATAAGSRLPGADRADRLLIITDGVGELANRTKIQIQELLEDLSHRDVDLQIIDVGSDREFRDDLPGFAGAGASQVIEVDNDKQLEWALQESVSGRSNVIARDAQLTVRFNPQVVKEYRLMGHEAASVLGVIEAPVQLDLRAGQLASGLFELKLHEESGSEKSGSSVPGNDQNLVGWAELEWRDPASGQLQQRRQRISRIQFAQTFIEMPMSLQAMAIAAETAELLRDSPFVDRSSSSLKSIHSRLRDVDQQMRQTPQFRRLVQFLERAQRAGIR